MIFALIFPKPSYIVMLYNGDSVKPAGRKAIMKQWWRKSAGEQDTLERVTETEDFYYQQGFSKWNYLAALRPPPPLTAVELLGLKKWEVLVQKEVLTQTSASVLFILAHILIISI